MTRVTYFVPSSSVRIERDSGVVTRRYLVQHFFASSTNSLAGETRVGGLYVFWNYFRYYSVQHLHL